MVELYGGGTANEEEDEEDNMEISDQVLFIMEEVCNLNQKTFNDQQIEGEQFSNKAVRNATELANILGFVAMERGVKVQSQLKYDEFERAEIYSIRKYMAYVLGCWMKVVKTRANM